MSGPAATLPLNCVRALSDRSYDKRKSGALEVEAIVKALVAEQRKSGLSPAEAIAKVVRRLAHDFIISANANQRKGGLIGLAGVAIGLGTEVGNYLDLLVPPVLKCFDDPEPRVRFYATEAMFNVVKVARVALLTKQPHFNAVFHGLCKVFADVDAEVKNGAGLLDRLLKDVVGECDKFDASGVIALFRDYFKVRNPFIRQLLTSWISALDSIPDLDMGAELPSLLDGLLDMLSDANKSIRDGAERAMVGLKQRVVAAPAQYAAVISATADILVRRHNDPTRAVRLVAVAWLGEMLALDTPVVSDVLVSRFADVLSVVMRAAAEEDDDEAGSIRTAGSRTDGELKRLARIPAVVAKLPDAAMFGVAIQGLRGTGSQHKQVRELALSWICLLLDVVPPERCAPTNPSIVRALLDAVRTDPLDVVVVQALAALARVARNSNQTEAILAGVCGLFFRDRALLESRGALVVRQLCVLLRPTHVFLLLAKIIDERSFSGGVAGGGGVGGGGGDDAPARTSGTSLEDKPASPEDAAFASLFVHALNVILLTASELHETRQTLRRAWVPSSSSSSSSSLQLPSPKGPGKTLAAKATNVPVLDDLDTFHVIFKAWCHNPIAALSLCFLSGAHALAGRLVDVLGEAELTVGLLVDADRLVRLLESPAFMHVRMQLLRSGPEFEPELLRALYGVLMLLPQKSDAYVVLQARLGAVTSMHMALAGASSFGVSSSMPVSMPVPVPLPSPPSTVNGNGGGATAATTTSTSADALDESLSAFDESALSTSGLMGKAGRTWFRGGAGGGGGGAKAAGGAKAVAANASPAGAGAAPAGASPTTTSFAERSERMFSVLLDDFSRVQALHSAARAEREQERSLLPSS